MSERKPFDRVEQGRRDAEKRWAKYRAARRAAGLPETKAQEKRLKPRYLDPDEQAFWIDEAKRLGLANGLEREALRRLAKRLADDAAEEEARRMQLDGPATPPVGDDDVLVAFHEAEAGRWRARAARDRAIAARHDQYAEDAEMALANLLHKLGRIS